MNNKLLPVCNIQELNEFQLETNDLISNGQCIAYYAVVIYKEDEIIYVQNNRVAFSDRLFELILHVANAGSKGIKGQHLADKMQLIYKDVYQYKDRVNNYKKYRAVIDKDLIVIDEKNYWHLNVNYNHQGLLII